MDKRKRPRVFTEESEIELLQAAQVWFNCTADRLHRVDCQTESSNCRTAMFCPEECWTDYANGDAEWELLYLPDGVYLELLPARGTGAPLNRTRLTEYIARKNLTGVIEATFMELVRQESGRARIAPPQPAKILDEELRVTVSADEMSADALLLPGDPGGRAATREDLNQALREKHIVYGIDAAALETLLTERIYYRPVAVAGGKAPIDGSSGTVQLLFENVHSGTPQIDPETGLADFHKLNWFTWVNRGDLLVTRTPATAGEKGLTVCGRELMPKHGREVQMPRGIKVIYNNDRTEMRAATDGRVEYKNGMVQVFDVYEVPGDVDMTVGNIEFAGNVVVRGNVFSGMKIHATGEVTVFGGVQGAEIEADGDVTIMNGLQGQGVGSVITKKTLYAKFIEQGTIRARCVVTDEIINSSVECSEDVVAVGRHGFISGGDIRARRMVAAQTIGTERTPKTQIEVGVDPAASRRYLQVQEEIKQRSRTVDELEKAAAYLLPRCERDPCLKKKLRQVVTTKVQFMQKLSELERERGELNECLNSANGGMVHVLDVVYPGATIMISGMSYPVIGTPIHNATFKLSEREVQFFTCQYSAEEGLRRSRHR